MYYSRPNLYQSYQQNSVMTASPMELIIMLYEAAIKNLKLAKLCIESKEYEKANMAFIKTENILCELAQSLDMKYPISKQLLELYEFFLDETIAANIDKSAQRILPILSLLEQLKQTWKEVKAEGGQVSMQQG